VQPDPTLSLPRETSAWEGEAQIVVSGQDKILVLMGDDCPAIKGDRVVVATSVDESAYTVVTIVGRSGGACFVGVVEA
jgi:hypothetical protein